MIAIVRERYIGIIIIPEAGGQAACDRVIAILRKVMVSLEKDNKPTVEEVLELVLQLRSAQACVVFKPRRRQANHFLELVMHMAYGIWLNIALNWLHSAFRLVPGQHLRLNGFVLSRTFY